MTTHDISKVAATLGTTSRTLRYYESEGLIESTTDGFSQRRRYTDEQIHHIKQVLILRSLGLPIAAIRELHASRVSLEDAILARRADVLRLIGEKQTEINLLEEALHRLRTGDSSTAPLASPSNPTDASLTAPLSPDGSPLTLALSETQLTISEACTESLLSGDYPACVAHFDPDMQVLLNEDALRLSWEMACTPLGAYRDRAPFTRLPATPNILCADLRFERGTLRVTYVFHDDLVCGLWSRYL